MTYKSWFSVVTSIFVLTFFSTGCNKPNESEADKLNSALQEIVDKRGSLSNSEQKNESSGPAIGNVQIANAKFIHKKSIGFGGPRHWMEFDLTNQTQKVIDTMILKYEIRGKDGVIPLSDPTRFKSTGGGVQPNETKTVEIDFHEDFSVLSNEDEIVLTFEMEAILDSKLSQHSVSCKPTVIAVPSLQSLISDAKK